MDQSGRAAAETHRLAGILLAAAGGRPPAADGAVDVLPSTGGLPGAVVGFPFHHVIAADIDAHNLRSQLPPDDVGAPLRAPFLSWLGERIGAVPGSLDVVLVAPPIPPAGIEILDLHPRLDLVDHPRVRRAHAHRRDLAVHTDPSGAGILILGRGLAGRLEVAFEVDPPARNQGLGRRLAAAAVRLAPAEEPLFAQVSPANVASLRAVLAAGFRPIGSEVPFAVAGEAR